MSVEKILSINLEADGLYGSTLAIGAKLVSAEDPDFKISSFQGRVPDRCATNEWVQKNVLPAIADMTITHESPLELERAFWEYWLSFATSPAQILVIAHVAHPVETGLFWRCMQKIAHGDFTGAYGIHDVATLLHLLGENPFSADAYVQKYELPVPTDIGEHHPYYDASVALEVWKHASARLRGQQ